MTLYEFYQQSKTEFELSKRTQSPLRYGQILFNNLYFIRPYLADEVRGSEIDPFYVKENDPKMIEFFKFIEEKWYIK